MNACCILHRPSSSLMQVKRSSRCKTNLPRAHYMNNEVLWRSPDPAHCSVHYNNADARSHTPLWHVVHYLPNPVLGALLIQLSALHTAVSQSSCDRAESGFLTDTWCSICAQRRHSRCVAPALDKKIKCVSVGLRRNGVSDNNISFLSYGTCIYCT